MATGTCLSETGIHQGSFLAAPRNRCATTRNNTQWLYNTWLRNIVRVYIYIYTREILHPTIDNDALIGIITCPKTLESNTNYLYVLSLILNHKACMVIKSQEKFHESGESKHISTCCPWPVRPFITKWHDLQVIGQRVWIGGTLHQGRLTLRKPTSPKRPIIREHSEMTPGKFKRNLQLRNTQIFLEALVTHPLHCLSWWDAVSRFRTISTMSSGKSALAILSEGRYLGSPSRVVNLFLGIKWQTTPLLWKSLEQNLKVFHPNSWSALVGIVILDLKGWLSDLLPRNREN